MRILCVFLTGLLVTCGPSPGTRLFLVEYVVDGQVVYDPMYEAGDTVPIDRLWDWLEEEPLMWGDSPVTFDEDEGDRNRATLSGDIEVRITHAGRRLASAKIGEIVLVREDVHGSPMWRLGPGQRRTLTDAAVY